MNRIRSHRRRSWLACLAPVLAILFAVWQPGRAGAAERSYSPVPPPSPRVEPGPASHAADTNAAVVPQSPAPEAPPKPAAPPKPVAPTVQPPPPPPPPPPSVPSQTNAPGDTVAPPVAAAQPAAAGTTNSLGLVDPPDSLALHTTNKTVFTFKADNLELKLALAAFARQNELNIVPDNDVSGTVTLDVRNLPLEQMMRALLEANDCFWDEKDGLIRVRSAETRIFAVDYLRLSRKGTGMSAASLAAGGSSSGSGGGASGGGGGGGGGSMGGGGAGGGSMGGGASGGGGGSAMNLTADNEIDFWKEIKEEVMLMLSDRGKNTLAVNKAAGLIQVTDRPSALKRVDEYLKTANETMHRQVEIEAKLFDVSLGDQFQFGIDWVRVTETAANSTTFGASTLPVAIGSSSLGSSALTMVFSNASTRAIVDALATQGKVEVISKPRIRTLNNQTALIKVGQERPFFSTSTTYLTGTSQSTPVQDSSYQMVTFGTILAITPQISADGWIVLEISPVLSRWEGTEKTGNPLTGQTTAPIMNTKQASSLVRVCDGSTVVMGGLIETETSRSQRKVPVLGDIPLLGYLFTGTFNAKLKRELVIFVTPHLIK